jgi:hypothetical protein
MIAQILSRSFLTAWLDHVQDELESLLSETDDPSGDVEQMAVTDTRLDIGDVVFDSGRRLFGAFEKTDVRWIAEQALVKALAMFRDRHP